MFKLRTASIVALRPCRRQEEEKKKVDEEVRELVDGTGSGT